MSSLNDPGCTVLEILLALLQSRTRADNDEMHFMQFSEKEVDELVDESTSEPLGAPLTPETIRSRVGARRLRCKWAWPKPANTRKQVLNLASYNFTGLASNETINVRATETLRKFGVGSCGPPVFYGAFLCYSYTLSVINDLGLQMSTWTLSADFLGLNSRGDIIVADRGINFAIQKGLHISRSTVRWFDYNDLKSLEDVLLSVEKEHRKRRGPLTRRFIVTEGIFEKDAELDAGLTELYNVPATQIDMIIGSVANGLSSSGVFCAGSRIVVDHQHINSTSFVFSAAVPALLAVSASEGIKRQRPTEHSVDPVRAIRAVLDRVEAITIIPSHAASPIIHIHLRSAPTLSASTSASAKLLNPATPAPRDAPSFDIVGEGRLLQYIVDEVLAQGVWISRARRLRGRELVETRPSIRLAVTAALSRKDCERAAGVFKATVMKVFTMRK
ncbi:serine palmitoyltransferase [Lactarius pseudohatsudake]|nr:serine palmitoyltransferase [Lactarius pseudohatsudake]